jgi:hypothetical protein
MVLSLQLPNLVAVVADDFADERHRVVPAVQFGLPVGNPPDAAANLAGTKVPLPPTPRGTGQPGAPDTRGRIQPHVADDTERGRRRCRTQ